jgi:hemin uptake protein HemP
LKSLDEYYAIANQSQYKKNRASNVDQPPRAPRPDDVAPDTADPGPLVIDSVELFAGRRELIIRHGTDAYRLRITASNKLS